MVTKKKTPAATPATVEARLTALELRVEDLEKTRLHLPKIEDFDKHKSSILTWVKANPGAAVLAAVLIGLLFGALMG